MPRGVYCGTVGYLAPEGAPGPRARFNVAIRTVVHDAETGGRRVRGRRGHHLGLAGRAPSTTRRSPRRGCSPRAGRRSGCWRRSPTCPASGYRRLEEHLARLRASAAYFGFALDEDGDRGGARARGGAVPRRRPRACACWSIGADASRPAPRRLPRRRSRCAWRSTATIRSTPPIRCCSTRRRCARATRRRPSGSPTLDDVVLVNTGGEVTETTRANIAVRLGERWVTPPLDAGLLPGCERAALLADGTLAEPASRVEELEAAAEIAFLNSVRRMAAGRPGGPRASRRRASRSPGTAKGRIVDASSGHAHKRASRRVLVHEHGTLAVRAVAHAHRRRLGQIVRHRGSHSGGAVPNASVHAGGP